MIPLWLLRILLLFRPSNMKSIGTFGHQVQPAAISKFIIISKRCRIVLLTRPFHRFFVHNTSLTPTMYGMGIGSAVYLSEATINNAYQTWIIEGIESLIGPIGGSDSLLSESTATTETITPSPSRTTSPIESIWSTA